MQTEPSRPRPHQPPGVDARRDRHRPRRRLRPEARARARRAAPVPARQGPRDALLLLEHADPGLVRGRHGAAGRPRPVHREPDDPDRARRHGHARSARSSAATTTASRSATSTGASATSTSARSPRRAGCPCSTCSATSTTRTRSLADLMTIREKFGDPRGRTITVSLGLRGQLPEADQRARRTSSCSPRGSA